MDNNIFDLIEKFIIEQGRNFRTLERTTRIEKDLKITGDDAVEFILSFGSRFNVDVSNFMAAEYFEPEGDKILPAVIRFFTGNKKRELLIGDLERAILAGKLDKNVIEDVV